MPFKSPQQRKFLFAEKPNLAHKFSLDGMGMGAKLPTKPLVPAQTPAAESPFAQKLAGALVPKLQNPWQMMARRGVKG